MLALLAASPMVAAALDDQDVVTISNDEYWMYGVELYEENGGVDEALTLQVQTVHQQGPPVNFFLLTEDNFDRYQRDEPFAAIQGERNHGIDGTYTTSVQLFEVGLYYLVWDNFDHDTGTFAISSSTFSYSVTGEDAEEAPHPGFLVLLFILLLTALVRRHR